MKIKNITYIFLLIAFKFSFSQVNPINNSISLDISTFPQNSAYTYDSCLAVGKGLGIGEVGYFQNWTAIETAPLTYDFTFLDIADYYYPLNSMPLNITITPIHTNKLEVPSDLVSTSFSSTVMISRFNRLLDSIKAHISNITVNSLVIGSEHDVYINSNATLWAEYTIFYNAVTAHAKVLWPGLKVATEITFDGHINYNSFVQTLNTNSDYIGVSYYPLNSNFTVKPVSTIPTDFATLVGLYPTKKLCFYQYGYPSSPTCLSSNLQQTQFITQTFTSWDTYSNNIQLIDFTWLHDLDLAQVNYWGTYYGITNPAFLEFLRTIGFRDWNGNGTDKPALNELRCQAKLRGFNTLSLTCGSMGINTNMVEETGLKLYPNPSNGIFTVDSQENLNIEVFDVVGKLAYKSETQKQKTEIDLSKRPKGLYFVRITKENKTIITQKILITQ